MRQAPCAGTALVNPVMSFTMLFHGPFQSGLDCINTLNYSNRKQCVVLEKSNHIVFTRIKAGLLVSRTLLGQGLLLYIIIKQSEF